MKRTKEIGYELLRVVDMETIEEIKNEMKDWFGFELTAQQVQEFLNDYPNANHFDTLERETFADYIAKKVTGMSFPMNGDSQEYKQKFYAELKKNSKPKWDIARVSHSTLINADCFDVFPFIEDKSIDAIICDLPFGTTACKWDSVLDLNKLWAEYERILKPKGNIVLFGAGMFAFKLALSNEKLFRYDMVWKKSKCGSPFTAKYMPLKKHEMILVFGESAAYYYPQMTEGTPYKRKWTPNKVNNMEYGIKGVQTDNKGTRHPITVLDFPQQWRRQDQIHPTQKPVELMEYLIKTYTNENEIVMDNTMGSGTTGLACLKTNRQFIGIEKEKQYYDVAVRRLSEYCG